MISKRFQYLFVAFFGGILLSAMLISSLFTLSSSAQGKSSDITALEIYSHWTSGREGDGLNALIDVYTSTHAGTSVTVLSDYDELADRMTSGNPPDSFVIHCGSELFYTWVEPGDYITPVTQLWTGQGWMDKFPQDLIDMLTIQGELYCIPLNIHRGNVLWYNKQVFSDLGLTPPTTFTQFFTVAQALETAGKIPLALGETWTAAQLMETVLLGSMGPAQYRGLWDGTTSFNGPEVRAALATFDQMMDYVNADYASLSWDQAVDLVGNGEAGMTIMGDWTESYLEDRGLVPDVDFGWMPVPGSNDSFIVVTDGFAMPRNAPNSENATDWLITAASVEGQEAFSPFKGAIPARLDANPSLCGIYFQSEMADYATDELVPTLVHGIAAPPSFVLATYSILEDFMANGNIESTANAWQQAACEAGFGECFVYLPLIVK